MKFENRNKRPKKKSTYWDYFNRRIDHQYPWIKPPMYACRDCNFTAKKYLAKCPRCSSKNIYNVGYCAKPPKKDASKKKWKEFWDIHGKHKDRIWH